MKEYKSLGIKAWSVEDRPREKLINKGISSLSDAELIAILIGSGTKNESAVELSRKILFDVNNNLQELGKITINDLLRYNGIGEAKAVTIISALELGRRRKLSDTREKTKICSSNDVFDYFHPLVADLPYEEFWIMLLNRANRVIEVQKISQGGIAGTVTDVRIILKNSLEKLASSLVLCHNHPSGNLQPSESDAQITHKLREAAALMDIKVIDHLIIADNAFYSFADEGVI
jgi:DNA repair protein RadC